jgi:poly(3-hydroxybutyrate) depolymerase
MPRLTTFGRLFLLCCGALLAVLSARAGDRGRLTITHGGHELPVWHYRPVGLAPDAPVLFVIHGVGRNADEYLEDWVALADAKKFLLVVPEFTKKEFPGEESFNSGNLFDAAGRLRPREEWSFSMIEPAFDAVCAQLGSTRNDYALYGHSAGAQFVQRFLYFVPDARVSRAVAANAGWYMLPELDRAFPYGLKGTPIEAAALRRALAFPLNVLLGDADIDPKHASLRHSPEADEQGFFRFARGQYFFNRAKAVAGALNTPFNWMLSIAPNVAHSNKGMAPYAARLLFPH